MIIVITNESAGTDNDDKVATIREAFAVLGAEVEIVEAKGSELTAAARDAATKGARVVVAAGGDGTVNAVAAALVGSSTPLGVLPMGTLNHFAKDAGIPLDLAEAAALIVSGAAAAVDLASVNDRIFINNSSIGVYPLMVRDREKQQSRFKRSKWWAMIRASVTIFKRFPTFGVRMTVDGKTVHYQTPAVMVGNNVYALDVRMLGTREKLDGGVLAVYAVRTRTRWKALTLVLSALFSKLEEHDLFDVAHTEALSMDTTHAQLDVSLDGEVVRLGTPLNYQIMNRALQVVLPPPA